MKYFVLDETAKPSGGSCYRDDCDRPAVAVVECVMKPFSVEVCDLHAEALLKAIPIGENGISIPGSPVDYPIEAPESERCPFHSRAQGYRCELLVGHDDLCENGGDGFKGGHNPWLEES